MQKILPEGFPVLRFPFVLLFQIFQGHDGYLPFSLALFLLIPWRIPPAFLLRLKEHFPVRFQALEHNDFPDNRTCQFNDIQCHN